MMDLNGFLANLNSMGFYDFVLPWILFLVIFFSIISKASFLPEKNGKQIAVIIGAILAFFTINIPVHGIPLGTKLAMMFGWSGIYVAGILVVILFIGMIGVNLENIFGSTKQGRIAVGLVLVLIAILVLANAGFPLLALSDVTWTFIFVLLLVGGAVLFLGGEEDGNGGNSGNDAK